MKLINFKYILIALIIALQGNCYAKIKMKKNSSSIDIDANAYFIANTPVSTIEGSISQAQSSQVQGATLKFSGGVLSKEGNKAQITGVLNASNNTVALQGDGKVSVLSGSFDQPIVVEQTNNRLEGPSVVNQGITLQDSISSITLAVVGKLPSSINLNNGTVFLEQDLELADGQVITGSGTLLLNNRSLVLGKRDLVWTSSIYFHDAQDIKMNADMTLMATCTFSGNSVWDGDMNTIYLESGATIVVDSDSSLLIKNAVLHNIQDGFIKCVDDTGQITLQDVTWIQAEGSTFKFTNGTLNIYRTVKLMGVDVTFAYQSSQVSTILGDSALILDQGVTFSYDPIIVASKDLLAFEENTSQLVLKEATLHATVTGMNLLDGVLSVQKDSVIESETQTIDNGLLELPTVIDEGITLGNSSDGHDMECRISAGATLTVAQGSLNYKNVGSGMWHPINVTSVLTMATGTRLNIYETLDLGQGILRLEDLSTIALGADKDLIGSIDPQGTIIRTHIPSTY